MVAQRVAGILKDHVRRLSVECLDRMYLNVYVPALQIDRGVAWFFRYHRGQPVTSLALMAPMSRRFVAALQRYADVPRTTQSRRLNLTRSDAILPLKQG